MQKAESLRQAIEARSEGRREGWLGRAWSDSGDALPISEYHEQSRRLRPFSIGCNLVLLAIPLWFASALVASAPLWMAARISAGLGVLALIFLGIPRWLRSKFSHVESGRSRRTRRRRGS